MSESGESITWRVWYEEPVSGTWIETRSVMQFLPGGEMLYTVFEGPADAGTKVLKIAYSHEGNDAS